MNVPQLVLVLSASAATTIHAIPFLAYDADPAANLLIHCDTQRPLSTWHTE